MTSAPFMVVKRRFVGLLELDVIVYFHSKRINIQKVRFWNDMKVSTWWQNLQFWVKYPFNHISFRCLLSALKSIYNAPDSNVMALICASQSFRYDYICILIPRTNEYIPTWYKIKIVKATWTLNLLIYTTNWLINKSIPHGTGCLE